MLDVGITTDEAIDLAITVWHGFLGVELVPCFDKTRALNPEASISACVTIKGSWYGGITVALPISLGAAVTRRALQLDDPQPDDIRDVVGELANMMAGRLKHHLPPDTQISLPMVATGDHCHLSMPGADVAMELAFTIEDTPLYIRIIKVEGT